MQSDKVLNLPAGYFGIVLGPIGMGFAWRYASQVWQVSRIACWRKFAIQC